MLHNMVLYGVRECPVCYEPHTAAEAAFLLQCKHVVCVACAIKLLQTAGSCPECRGPFSLDSDSFAVLGSVAYGQKLRFYLTWKCIK